MKTNDVKNLRLKLSECGKSMESCGIVSVTIAQLNPCGSLTTKEQREVAERIVQAVNHHEELVGVLESIMELDTPSEDMGGDWGTVEWASQVGLTIEKAKNLLTKLKG